jgi:hypothetical protein
MIIYVQFVFNLFVISKKMIFLRFLCQYVLWWPPSWILVSLKITYKEPIQVYTYHIEYYTTFQFLNNRLGDPLHSLLIINTRLSQQQDFNIEPYGEMLKYLFRNHKPDLKTSATRSLG